MTISNKIKDTIVDSLDKVSTPTSRVGVTIERIVKMANAGVSNRAIVAQLEDNSHSGQKYSEEQVDGFKKLYKDAETKVGVAASQARALISDQQEAAGGLPPDVVPNPQ